MNCQNCGAPMVLLNDKLIFYCEHCGANYLPEANRDGVRILGEQSLLKCPVCNIYLVSAALDGSKVQHCERCLGLLIQVNDFQDMVHKSRLHFTQAPIQPPPVDMDDLRRKIQCPSCGKTMDTHPYSGPGNFVIDNCPSCRVNWLDYEEFRRAVTAPDRAFRDDNPIGWLIPPSEQTED
jgi:Zn-finger nucleic acid-binding protein